MSIKGNTEKELVIVLFVIAFSAPCLSATDRIINRNTNLTFQSNTEQSSSTQATGQRTLQQSEAGSALKRFRTELRHSVGLLKNEIEEVSKKAARKRKREQDESAIPDMIALHRATEIFETVYSAVALLRMRPKILGINIQQTTGGDIVAAVVSGDESYVVSIPQLSRPISAFEFSFAWINRQNSAAAIKVALDNCSKAEKYRLLPNEIESTHKAEIEKYNEVRNLADTANELRVRAIRDLMKITDQPALLKEKIDEWEVFVGEAVKKARSALGDLRNIPQRPTYRFEPLGYTITKQPLSSTSKSANEVQMAVNVRVRLDYFLPPIEGYQNFMELYNFRRSSDSDSSHDRRVSARISELRVFDSSLFKLVLEDGRKFPSTEFLDPNSWGDYPIDSTHFRMKARSRVKNHRCVIGYSRQEPIPPTLDIRMQWVLDANDCKPPFKLQFAEFTPVFIPENQLEALPVDESPQDSSHDTTVVLTRAAGKKAALIIGSKNFRDEELFETKRVLEAAQVQIFIASTKTGSIRSTLGNVVEASLPVNQLKVDDYDVIIFIGGPGAAEYVSNPAVTNMVRETVRKGKVLAAIGVAPTILANANVLAGIRATSYLSERDRLEQAGAIYTGFPVQRERSIITATGPQAAVQFGRAIVDALAGK